MINNQRKLIVIVGPTGSGKTCLAVDLASKYNGEIVCADSRTIYRYMDIGTAKPNKKEQALVKHHLLDIKYPNQPFSVAEFRTLCEKTISSIWKNGKIPFLVGGSGLYIDAYLYSYSFRSSQNRLGTSHLTDEQVQNTVAKNYPELVTSEDLKNVRRMRQLLERGPSNTGDRKNLKVQCKIIGLRPNKLTLKHNIQHRTMTMLDNSFVQEVEIINTKFGKPNTSSQTTGYKQINEFLDGIITRAELPEAINSATTKLAKKQLTWFKRNRDITWCETSDEAEAAVKSYLEC